VPRSLISNLTRSEQRKLLDDLNYLNTSEIKRFCKKHSIPYAISFETPDGRRKRAGADDRKGVMLDRVRHFLTTGAVPPETCFPAAVVCFDPGREPLAADDRLHYGQYDKGNRALMRILSDLTDGKFRNGDIARILAREFWSRGEAPTLEAFAAAWVRASREHTRPNPEWAFLSDLANQTAAKNWRKLRKQKAKKVLEILDKIHVTKLRHL